MSKTIRERFTQNVEQFDSLMTEMLAENDALRERVRALEEAIQVIVTDVGECYEVACTLKDKRIDQHTDAHTRKGGV